MVDFISNVVANFVALGLLVALGWCWHVNSGRRALLKFFGVKQDRTLKIYVGHVPFSSVPKGFVGFEEISEAKNLEALFRSVIPGLEDQPGFFKFLRVADIQTEILPGEINGADVSLDHSLVSIGSPTSNFASSLLESELKNPVRCDRASGNIQIPNLSPITDSQAVVVRICSRGKNYFYVAGKFEPITAAGTRFLIQNWKSMREKYGDETSFYYLVEMKFNSRKVFSVANNELQIAG